ncbi:hypothetical protein DI005_08990 [Prauserella sp. PE36]|nr:hypothetical protein DI005_08990 [Prauserella sp. PE36]
MGVNGSGSTGASHGGREPRTVLEQQIREVRRETLQEFVEFAERFAREHGEQGTLSLRHLDRLVSGRGPKGKPLGKPRPATARLLERIFGVPIDVLLSAPAERPTSDAGEAELLTRLRSAAQVDDELIDLLHGQLTMIRRLDRQLGAVVAHEETATKVEQVSALLRHSLQPARRRRLASLLSEVCTLAGWQALDAGRLSTSWRFYERAKTAARESGDLMFEAHATAEQAFVLTDLGQQVDAVQLLSEVRNQVGRGPRVLRSWLAAAHGEVLAGTNRRTASLRAFDEAAALLPAGHSDVERPYVALGDVHLARWRGHALARVGEPDAVDVLTGALDNLDPSFTRAQIALRVDLATAYVHSKDLDGARHHVEHAAALADAIGSNRQLARLRGLQLAG